MIVLAAGFVFLIYMPTKACNELDALCYEACEEGIDLVEGSDLRKVDNYRKLALFLDGKKRAEYDYKYNILQRAVFKWDWIHLEDDFAKEANHIKNVRMIERLFERIKRQAGGRVAIDTKTSTFRPYAVGDKVFIVRIGFDDKDIQPTDFPIYTEYCECMDALGVSDVISYEEYQQLMGRETIV